MFYDLKHCFITQLERYPNKQSATGAPSASAHNSLKPGTSSKTPSTSKRTVSANTMNDEDSNSKFLLSK